MPKSDEMRQNGTDLTPPQLTVLEQLISGATITSAAAAAAVSRTTVHRWLRNDYVFQAEFNRSRTELQTAIHRSLLAVAHRAAQNVGEAVEGGDIATSLKVLKGIGALSGTPEVFGTDDPEVLRDEVEIDRASRKNDRDLQRLLTF